MTLTTCAVTGWEIAATVATIGALALAVVAIFTANATAARERRLDHQLDALTHMADILAGGSPGTYGWSGRVQLLLMAANLGPGELPVLRSVFQVEPLPSYDRDLLAAVQAAFPETQATAAEAVGLDFRWELFGYPRYRDEIVEAIRVRTDRTSYWIRPWARARRAVR